MQLPVSLHLSGIGPKEIYYFSSARLSSAEPHYYICIKKTDGNVVLLCVCTTKKETVVNRVKAANWPMETIVNIKASTDDPESPLPKESWVNCNNIHPYTMDEIKEMFEKGTIEHKSTLGERYYEEIVSGICMSPNVSDEIKEILNAVG